MTAKRRAAPPRAAAPPPPPPPPPPAPVPEAASPRFSLSPELKIGLFKWVGGGLLFLLSLYTGWKTVVWPDIKDYWRIESVAEKKDSEHEQALKDAKAAADLALKEHKDDDVKSKEELTRKIDKTGDDLTRKIDKTGDDLSRKIDDYAQDAVVGRAWVKSGVSGLAVGVAGLTYDQCRRDNKGKPDACRSAEDALNAARTESTMAKAGAQNTTEKKGK